MSKVNSLRKSEPNPCGARLQSLCGNYNSTPPAAKQVAEIIAFSVIPSEARNPSGV